MTDAAPNGIDPENVSPPDPPSAFGFAVLDFGSGATEASVFVPSVEIGADAAVEAWIRLLDDAHRVEALEFYAGDIVAGVGFTLYAKCTLGRASGQYGAQWSWEPCLAA